jgi:hypothetical protein
MLRPDSRKPAADTPDCDARAREMLERIRAAVEPSLRAMAEEVTDLSDADAFGAVELRLRDLAHEAAARAHQAGLDADKKRAT